MDIAELSDDTCLSLSQLSRILQLDQRTVARIALELGGKRVGRRWRFRWGTVMEYFSDADFAKRSWERLVGPSHNTWQNTGLEILSRWKDERAGMDGSKTMGDEQKKRNPERNKSKSADPYGLRAALGLG